LVVVEDGNVQRLLEPLLDDEASRGRDVLEVDAAEDRRDALNRLHDLVDILGVEADREGVDAAELLEEHGFALHDRQGALRPQVAKPEDSAAVGHDSHAVALDGQAASAVGVLGDGSTDARHARRVGHREVVASLDGDLADDLDLAAGMELEGAVGILQDLDPIDGLHRPHDGVGMLGVAGMHCEFAHDRSLLEINDVNGSEIAARAPHLGGQPAQHAGPVLEPAPGGEGETGRQRRQHVRILQVV